MSKSVRMGKGPMSDQPPFDNDIFTLKNRFVTNLVRRRIGVVKKNRGKNQDSSFEVGSSTGLEFLT